MPAARAGWIVQDNADFNRNAGEGVAVREFSPSSGTCDYLLFVGGKAVGVIEAKKLATLSGAADQVIDTCLVCPSTWQPGTSACCSTTNQAARKLGCETLAILTVATDARSLLSSDRIRSTGN